jgi:hypothetical protein
VPVLALVLAVALLAAAGWCLGRLLVAGLPTEGGLLAHALALATGLAALAQAAFLLALGGVLVRPLLGALAVALAAAAALGRRRLRGPARDWTRTELAAGAAIAATLLVVAAYPPTGFDETAYHLPMARAFAESGSLPFLGDLVYPAFPALAESLVAALWLAGGEAVTHAPGVVAALATTALLLAGVARRPAGWTAAALYAGSPIVVYLAGSGYVEPLLALWVVAALLANAQWRASGRRGWAAVAGLLAGSAAATKYLGCLLLAYATVEALTIAGRRRDGSGAVWLAAAAAAALPTYARLWLLTGNPLFPFYPGLFGGSPWSAEEFLGARGWSRLGAAASSFWDVAFRRERIGRLPPFTPVLPFLVPLLLWALARVRASRRWLGLALLFLLVAPVNAHYLVMILPAVALGAAEAVAALRSPPGRAALAVASLALGVPGMAYAASWVWRFGAPPVGAAARERYLADRLPLYPAVRALQRLAGERSDAYAVGAEQMTYFAPGRWRGQHNGPASYQRVLPAPPDPELLAARLRRLGVAHLLMPEEAAAALLPPGPAAAAHFELLHRDGSGRVYRVREP